MTMYSVLFITVAIVVVLNEVAYLVRHKLEVLKTESNPNSLTVAARNVRKAYISGSENLNSYIVELLSHYEQDDNGLYLVEDGEGNQLREFESSITAPVYCGLGLQYFPSH